MRVIVTGGSGDIGEFVVEELRQGHRVTVVDVKEPRRNREVDFRRADLTDRHAALTALREADAVVHLAAIPHPYSDPGERVMQVNMVSTYNVLEAMRENGIRKGVYAGSDSGTGFGIHHVPHVPLYLPIDKEHPCWPHESYSLTKYFGELMFREYGRAYGPAMISVRFMWVWLARDSEKIRKALEAARNGRLNWLCSYVMPRDAAQMISLALDHPMEPAGFDVFHAHSAQTFSAVPTLELAGRIWGKIPQIRRPEYYEEDPFAPFFDLTRERAILGYSPRCCWKDYSAKLQTGFGENRDQEDAS